MEGFPPLLRSDVQACTFSSWYPKFRKHSPKATIIKPLEDKFIDYLESDSVFIPTGSGPIGISELSDDESGNGSDSSEDQSWQITFPELDAEIRKVIVKYDGAVFPKLNWTSPQDSAWMVPGPPLKCQSPADVYLLLKSSDFISHDLDHAFEMCSDRLPQESIDPLEEEESVATTSRLRMTSEESSSSTSEEEEEDATVRSIRKKKEYEFELVLKKWFEMPKSQEWRCFVREKKLIAITHRDTTFYPFLQPIEVQEDLKDKIIDFFEDEILTTFLLNSYTFDIYFTRTNDRIFLIDFNPYAPQTDSYLIPWSEINSLPLEEIEEPILRIVESQTMSSQPSFTHNRYPKDVIDVSSGASIAEFAKEWQATLAKGVSDTLEGGR